MSKRFTTTLTLILALAAAPSPGQTPREIEAAFRAAEHKEQVEGDLLGAIAQYRALTDAGDRRISAEALIRIGQAYEKLGSIEARKAYERVVHDYADQRDQLAMARMRLAALDTAGTNAGKAAGPLIRHVFDLPDFPYLQKPSRNGRYYPYIEWFGNDSALTVRDLRTGESHAVKRARGFPYSSVIAPDDQSIAMVWWHAANEMDIRTIRLDGSDERVLYSAPKGAYPEVHDWSPDGATVLIALQAPDRSAQIVLVSTKDGRAQTLKSLGWRWPDQMQFSPDGRSVVYDLEPDAGTREHDIYVLATDGSREVSLVEHIADDRRPFWMPDGSGVIFSSDRTGNTSLWQVPVVGGRSGEPALVQSDFPQWPRGMTNDGALMVLAATGSNDTYLTALDPDTSGLLGSPQSLNPLSVGEVGFTDWSLNGRFLAYGLGASKTIAPGRDGTLMIRELETGDEREITPDLVRFATNRPFRLSPDGGSLLIRGTTERGEQGVFELDTATGARIRMIEGTGSDPAWAPNGSEIYYFLPDASGTRQLVKRDLLNGNETSIGSPAPLAYIEDLTASPDGRLLAYTENRQELIVVQTSSGSSRTVFTGALIPWGGIGWMPDSESLLFVRHDTDFEGSLWKVSVEGGIPEPLNLSMEALRGIRTHPNGDRLMFSWGKPGGFALWVMEDFLP